MNTPTTARGVLIIAALLAVVVVAVYATSTVTIALGATVIAVAAYGLYILGYTIDDKLKNGF